MLQTDSKYPTSGRYPNRVLEDEMFCDFSALHLACSHCGDDDCPGLAEGEEYPPCVAVCSCCGQLPDECPDNCEAFWADRDRDWNECGECPACRAGHPSSCEAGR